eukprot:CAMPEP_0182834880 /NCGR_PEP_ID=MMETSP0006_2-20121128/21177_1 /TAXON_ID=97485 /ORGANISM="Prymnesium parvum, Strain Texoma1" /LENGTH=94 /DNA_ID=CAMNT_0024963209 /DNA_START=280 /DNA_END=560 /DNA_ORIENTATION=+
MRSLGKRSRSSTLTVHPTSPAPSRGSSHVAQTSWRPTFVHHNMRFGHPTLVDEKGYPSYNKPASVMFWLREVDPPEEYIALLDTDMLLLTPLDP